ncbi:MAG: transposase, partial [Aestuariibacter sp.]|nr:transposase [Aestuariibacter sp.]
MAELKLKALLNYHHISQANLAVGIGVSPATISLLVGRNRWPKSIPKPELENRITAHLQRLGITDMQLVGIFGTEEVVPRKKRTVKSSKKTDTTTKEITPMLLRKQVLTQQAKQLFGLIRDPFLDPQSSEELFISPEIRYVRENLYQVTRYGTFLAIVGESGSGKSTIRKDLHVRLEKSDTKDVIIIEPYIIGMEDNDSRGKTLKAGDIATAIMESIAPGISIPSTSERRFRKVHQALKESHRLG